MKKSVYSIVLMDDVVDAVDRMAYSLGTSRSNLINQILAEHLSFTTPEQRMKSIFGEIEQLMNEDCFRIIDRASDAMMSIKSALRYKYKPTIHYLVELFRSGDMLGELRVSFRTQNRILIDALTDFFRLWAALENKYIAGYFDGKIICSIDDGKYTRQFVRPKSEITDEKAGNAIAEYIRNFDYVLKTYFENIDGELISETEKAYVDCLKNVSEII